MQLVNRVSARWDVYGLITLLGNVQGKLPQTPML